MRNFIILLLLLGSQFNLRADSTDHWMILVNGERVFECPATCSSNGLNLQMLKCRIMLKDSDKVTVVYQKDKPETKITKNFIVTDSAVTKFQNFSVYDEDGTHAITVKAHDFMSMHGIVIWYSEKKKVNGVEVTTQRVPLVYFE